MAVCFFTSSGGDGADTSVVTAGAADVLSGKVIVDANGNPLTGTMTNRGAISQSLGINGSYTIPQGYHNGSGKVSQSISTMGAQTITPKSSAQTVSCSGKYMTGNITVNAASIYKVVSGTVTSSSSTKTFTDEYGNSSTYYYFTISISGFKQVIAVNWYGYYTAGRAIANDYIYVWLNGEVGTSRLKCTTISASISLPSGYQSKSANSSITYYVYGVAS